MPDAGVGGVVRWPKFQPHSATSIAARSALVAIRLCVIVAISEPLPISALLRPQTLPPDCRTHRRKWVKTPRCALPFKYGLYHHTF